MRLARWRWLPTLVGLCTLALGCSGRPCEDDDGPQAPRVRLDLALQTCNQRPVAGFEAPARAGKAEEVVLDGTPSADPEGAPLRYRWTIEGPDTDAVEVRDADSATPRFVPGRAGLFEIALVVSDGDAESTVVTQTLRAVNTPPIADAGADVPVPVGQTVTLDGTGSVDPDGDALTYRWRVVQRPPGASSALLDAGSAQPSLLVDVPGVWEIGLVVSDGEDESPEVQVRVGGGVTGGPPVANAGAQVSAFTGQTARLDGRGSVDPDGDPLRYTWRLVESPAGSEPQWTSTSTTRPGLVVDRPGTYRVELVVDDGFYRSAPAAASILAAWGAGDSGDLCAPAGCREGAACVEGICVGVGRLRFSLTWTVVTDFDLHVKTPDGTEIYFANTPAGGGDLDVDDCVGGGCRTFGTHVENIVFENTPPPGRYEVWVVNYDGLAAGDFGIEVRGAVRTAFNGNLPALAGQSSTRFVVRVP